MHETANGHRLTSRGIEYQETTMSAVRPAQSVADHLKTYLFELVPDPLPAQVQINTFLDDR
jgi:hypothetical protein